MEMETRRGKDVSLTKKIDLFGSERRFPLPGVAKKRTKRKFRDDGDMEAYTHRKSKLCFAAACRSAKL